MKKQSPKLPPGASASPPSAPTPPPFTPADTTDYLFAHFPAGVPPRAPQPPPPQPFDLRDPEAVYLWGESMRAALLDLAAAAQEGARRSHKRVLSRGEIRRQARDALAHTTNLLDQATAAATRLRTD